MRWPWPWCRDRPESRSWTCSRGTSLCPCPFLCFALRHSPHRRFPSPYSCQNRSLPEYVMSSQMLPMRCAYLARSLALRHPHSCSNLQKILILRKTLLPQAPVPHPRLDAPRARKFPALRETARTQRVARRQRALDAVIHHTHPGHHIHIHDCPIHHRPRISDPVPQDTTAHTSVHYTMPRGHTPQDELH